MIRVTGFGVTKAARGATPEVREQAAERQRQVIALRIRGISFEANGQQLGISREVAHKLSTNALRGLPKSVNASELRRREDERIAEMRARLWSEWPRTRDATSYRFRELGWERFGVRGISFRRDSCSASACEPPDCKWNTKLPVIRGF